jgi:cytoskeletal protein CcmA (bactofilin family)
MPRRAQRHAGGGFVLLYVIIAIVLIGGAAFALSSLSSSANTSSASYLQTKNARYLAESGILYAKGLVASYEKQSKTIDAAVTALNAGAVSVPGAGSFTLSATKSGSSIAVTATGTTQSGAAILLPQSVSIAYSPAQSEASTTQALKGTYSGASAYIAGAFSGSVATQSATLSGGSNVGGSVNYLGTGSPCLTITGGVTVGTAGNNNYVCSDSCVVADGGTTINGNIYSQGSVTLASTTVNGDVYSGGDVTITSGTPTINGNIYLTGTFTKPSWYTYKGTVTKISSPPSQCVTYKLPAHTIVAASSVLKLNGGKYTFYGKSDLSDKSNAYIGITSNGWPSVCFDLSTPGTYINFFINGNMSFSGNIYVRTSTATSCFDSSNQITSTNFANYAAASRVYMDVTGTVTFGGGSNWFGTIYAGDNIYPGGDVYIGAFYTNKSFNPNNSWINTRFVLSDYVATYWP